MSTSSTSDCGCHGAAADGRRASVADPLAPRVASAARSASAERHRAGGASAFRQGVGTSAARSSSSPQAARLTSAAFSSSALGARAGSAAPMALLGTSEGLTIIDPATALTRLWYFDGRFLRAEGFRLDQEYVRSLVALSNRAVGTGVVHGLDVDLLGDRLRVEGGLGLAPSGRVVHLASTTDLGIGELIARSTGALQKTSLGASVPPDFGPCPPDTDADADAPVAHRTFYVLTAASAEALCGEEERFGQLCGDACSADVDRSVAVEGVRFRARRVTLALPTSRTVPFTSTHLRSQVASAFYRLERLDVPSMISGAGLRTAVWCDGAEGIGGEEIPLAVFDRAGTITTFADMWTGRREIVENSPQRYWQWRTSMRPLDVFLAQVLQFQCQLADLPAGASTPSPTDPCADERGALVDVHEALGVIGGAGDDIAGRLDELRERVSKVLDGSGAQLKSGSLLIDRGIVETPPAGYLPVDPRGDVQAQTEAWFGPGVDLRFCVVRADFVPEAFQEAQHMDRISLTQGIDDPRAVEQVDVLVPGASFKRRQISTAGYEGTFDVLPTGAAAVDAAADRAALRLSAVAREHRSEGWSWTLAAFGEAPQRLGVSDLVSKIDASLGKGVDPASFAKVHLESTDLLDAIRTRPSVASRVLREATGARARAFRVAEADFAGTRGDDVDAPVEATDRRPVAMWFDAESARGLDDLPVGGATGLRMRLVFYSRASTTPAFLDLGFAGTATVRDRQVESTGVGGSAVITVRTTIDGALTTFSLAPAAGSRVIPLAGASLTWRIQTSPTGRRIDGVQFGVGDRPVLEARFTAEHEPRLLSGEIASSGGGRAVARVANTRTGLAAFELTEKPGVFDLGSPGRDLAASVVDIIGAELVVRRQDAAFEADARRRIFGDPTESGDTLAATADWIMFHRRRTKDCGETATPAPTRVIRYRWLHGISESRETLLERLRAAAGSGAEGGLLEWLMKELDLTVVAAVEYAEGSTALASSVPALRAAWMNSERGDRLVASLGARWGAGEGAAIEGGRLASGVRALEGLVDATDVVSLVLADAPAMLQSEGFDGVFLTVGVARQTARAEIILVSRDGWARVRGLLTDRAVGHEELLKLIRSSEQVFIEPFVAEFDGPDLADPDKLREWWRENGRDADFLVDLVLDRAIAPLGGPARIWTERRDPAVRDIIGGPEATNLTVDVTVDLDEVSALFVCVFPDLG